MFCCWVTAQSPLYLSFCCSGNLWPNPPTVILPTALEFLKELVHPWLCQLESLCALQSAECRQIYRLASFIQKEPAVKIWPRSLTPFLSESALCVWSVCSFNSVTLGVMMKRLTIIIIPFPTLILQPPDCSCLCMSTTCTFEYEFTFTCLKTRGQLQVSDYARLTGQWVSGTFLSLPLQCWDYKHVKYIWPFFNFFFFEFWGLKPDFHACMTSILLTELVISYTNISFYIPLITCFKTEGTEIISQDPCLFSKLTTSTDYCSFFLVTVVERLCPFCLDNHFFQWPPDYLWDSAFLWTPSFSSSAWALP